MEKRASRRRFLQTAGAGAATLAMAAQAGAKPPKHIPGLEDAPTDPNVARKKWKPVSDRKVRVGIVGYGVCRWGAAFGFQDHPNVQVVAVSDLFPDRCAGLAKACRCSKTYPSLEELVKDDTIEAVFVATDAPSHARHAIEVLKHGKHVAVAVPAVWGNLEDAHRLFETVKRTGLKYMMFETSSYRADCYAMRRIYQAGGFGKVVYMEGEYFHRITGDFPSYKGWRTGSPPLWYPTHATAYYVSVTGGYFTSVSCQGFHPNYPLYRNADNPYKNPFNDEVALMETDQGGTARISMVRSVYGYHAETGRIYGERGSYYGNRYHGTLKKLPDLSRPPLPPGVRGGGHGGSHGHLTEEFIRAILEDRQPSVDVVAALNMTVCGVVAHQSALRDGERLPVPVFKW